MPSVIRLYVQDAISAPGQRVVLSEDQRHYIKNVMRVSEGGALRIFNTMSGEWTACAAFAKKEAAAIAQQRILPPASPAPLRWLALSTLRPHLLSLVIEKATELGTTHIQLITATRTQPHSTRIDKLQRTAIEASEQCERLDIPTILPPRPIADFCSNLPGDCAWFAALERADAPLLLSASRDCPSGGIIIGPEGGFTPDEAQLLAETDSIQCVSLGPNILRAETAALYSLSILQANSLPVTG